jgi:hypothetical protein
MSTALASLQRPDGWDFSLDQLLEKNGLKLEFFSTELSQRVQAWQHVATALNESTQEARQVLDAATNIAAEIIWYDIEDFYNSGEYEKLKTSREMLKLKLRMLKFKLDLMSIATLSGLSGGAAERFSTVEFIPRTEIITDPLLFQNRQTAFAQETVDKIVREGFDKSQDPIIVWEDNGRRKFVVISGHSRWEGSEILFRKGDKSLAKMPVKRFLGTLEEAINYALLESNRSGTAEGLKSDLRAFKRASMQGYNRAALLSLFKPESHLRLLQDLSHLNEAGRFLEHLGEDSESSYPSLRRNAQWVGTMRKMYPGLSDSHEREMFQYLYKDKSRSLTKKDVFFEMVQRKVTKFDFRSDLPLNLENVVSTSALTDPIREQIRTLEERITFHMKERERKEANLIRAKAERNEKLVQKFQEDILHQSQAVLRLLEEKARTEQQMRKLEQSSSFDLFSTPPPAPAPRPISLPPAEVDPPLEQIKLKLRMLKFKLELLNL